MNIGLIIDIVALMVLVLVAIGIVALIAAICIILYYDIRSILGDRDE